MASRARQDHELTLAKDLAGFVHDPEGFVYYAYPWNRSGTLLATHKGPDHWQLKALRGIGRDLETCHTVDEECSAVQHAFASGHGVGKTAFMSWLIQWFMSTAPQANIVATANTRAQLINKFWRELARWHKLLINAHWFEWTATSFYHKAHKATWRANAVPWSETNSEAFAGLHETNVMVLMDESSAIADVIFDVTSGAMTTRGAIWVATGNPTRNSGRFRDCFPGGKFAHRWKTRQIDSRTARMANKKQLQDWIDDYGEDSDFVRVRVKGQFPRAGSMQLISTERVNVAVATNLQPMPDAVRVLSVDVARFGDDKSVVTRRQGNKVFPQRKFRGLNTMELVAIVVQEYNDFCPHAIFVDGNGLGAGVVDRLRQLGLPVIDVQLGGKALREDKYFNKRAECWGNMAEALEGEYDLPNDPELITDLTGIEYGYDIKFRLQLEKKSDMKRRGLDSPDCGDSIALGYAMPVNEVRRAVHENASNALQAARRHRCWQAA